MLTTQESDRQEGCLSRRMSANEYITSILKCQKCHNISDHDQERWFLTFGKVERSEFAISLKKVTF